MGKFRNVRPVSAANLHQLLECAGYNRMLYLSTVLTNSLSQDYISIITEQLTQNFLPCYDINMFLADTWMR